MIQRIKPSVTHQGVGEKRQNMMKGICNMWPFKKNPYKYKYVQIKIMIPRGNTKEITSLVPIFTNKPDKKDTGLMTFDLDNKSDINKICRLNYGYKKNNFNIPYISHEIITFCVESYNQRGLKNNGKS